MEARKQRGVSGRSQGQDAPFKDIPQVTHLLQLGRPHVPESHHLQKYIQILKPSVD
jgi:hypothetical protein